MPSKEPSKPRKVRIRKRNLDDHNDLRNYTEVDKMFFTELYKKLGKTNEYFKLVEKTDNKPIYYVWTDYLINNKPKK